VVAAFDGDGRTDPVNVYLLPGGGYSIPSPGASLCHVVPSLDMLGCETNN